MSDCLRLPNESFDDYFVRLCENKNVFGLTFEQVADRLNAESGKSLGESAWRKRWKNFHQGRLYERKQLNNSMMLEQAREIEKQRIRLSEERTALKKMMREEARKDAFMEMLKEQMLSETPLPCIKMSETMWEGNGTLVVIASDWHIGLSFNTPYGQYNSDIAYERIMKYAEDVKAASYLYKAKRCVVAFAGDLISGQIHTTIRCENREQIVKQIKLASEYAAKFIAEIAASFEEVDVRSIGGNHSRVSEKEDAMLGEMLDDIIPFYVKARLSDFKNVCVHEQEYDTGFESFYIGNLHTILVHGDYDVMNDAGVAKLERLTQGVVDVLIGAHLHENVSRDMSKVHMLQGGTLSGSGDNYTFKRRLTCDPSQLMAYFDSNNKLRASLPVYFD